MFSRTLFPGRFQPVHNGHIAAIRWLLGISEEVVVLVTAAQYSYTLDNPFTAGERITMLRYALRDAWDRLYVIPLDNIPDNSLWLDYVEKRVPRFEAVCTGNPFVELLARAKGYEVLKPPPFDREKVQGRVIRKLISEGGEWESLVPEAVANYIKSIRGVERLRALATAEYVVVKP